MVLFLCYFFLLRWVACSLSTCLQASKCKILCISMDFGFSWFTCEIRNFVFVGKFGFTFYICGLNFKRQKNMISLGWKWWQTVLEIEISGNLWEDSEGLSSFFWVLGGQVRGESFVFGWFPMCSHQVLKVFSWCSQSTPQVLNVFLRPNSTSFISYIVWPWFNFHVYKL
jgi:hypothetical protein